MLMSTVPVCRMTRLSDVTTPAATSVVIGSATQLGGVADVTIAHGTENASAVKVTVPVGRPPIVSTVAVPGVTSKLCFLVFVPFAVTLMQATSAGTAVSAKRATPMSSPAPPCPPAYLSSEQAVATATIATTPSQIQGRFSMDTAITRRAQPGPWSI